MIPVHIVNLENRIDRKNKLLEELKKHDVKNYTFTNAVNGYDLNIDEMALNKTVDFTHRKLTRGNYGCYLSHLNIFKSILNHPEDMHLVLEDDAFFVEKFNNKLDRLLKKVQNVEWDIFYLGINRNDFVCGEFVTHDIYYPKYPLWGTHGYLIKKETIEKIIDQLLPIKLPIDVTLMNMDIKRLTLRNLIIKTNNSDSDTQSIN